MNSTAGRDGEPVMKLNLLGPPVLTCQTRSFSLPRRQARALLFRLAVAEQPVSREELTDLLWPNKPPPTARRNLTRLLSYLRHQLPQSDLLEGNKTAVSLNLTLVTSDVVQFRKLCQTDDPADWETAVSLYRGSFLAGFALNNSSEFDNWLNQEQYQFERLYLETLRRLVQTHAHKPAIAIPFAQKYLAIDDLAEDIHRWLITLYSAHGDRLAALQQYKHCVAVLEQELGVSPLPETDAVYDAVRKGRVLRVRETVVQPEWMSLPGADVPLVGREQALATLAEAYGRFRTGGVIFLSGESGAGKSRLMQTFANGCKTLVLGGNSYAESGATPYQPLLQVLRLALSVPSRWQHTLPIWLAELARLLPELPTYFSDIPEPLAVDPQQAQARLFEALRQLFRSLATASPLLLCLDDVHWADESTKEWLLYFTRQLRGSQVCILATYRTSEQPAVASWQWALKHAGLMTTVTLDGLTRTAVFELLRQLDTNFPKPEQLAHRIHTATGGNSFFVLETIREIMAREEFDENSASLPLSPTVRDAILHRAGSLTPLARQVLEVTAILSPRAPLNLIAETAGREPLGTASALEELTSQQLLRTEGSQFQFQHDLAREAIYQNISIWRRQLLHQRAANRLLTLPQREAAALEVVARHFAAGGDNEQAIHFYQQAADAAAVIFAHQEAIAHTQRAIDLVLDSEAETAVLPELYESLADNLMIVGNFEEAEKTYHLALSLLSPGDPLKVAELQYKLAATLPPQQREAEAEGIYRKALARLDKPMPSDMVHQWQMTQLNLLLGLLDTLYFQQRLQAMVELKAQTGALLDAVGTSVQKAKFSFQLNQIAWLQHRYRIQSKSLTLAQETLQYAELSGNALLVANQLFHIGFQLLWYGDLENAEKTLGQAMQDSKTLGDSWLYVRCLVYLTVLYRFQGDDQRVQTYQPQLLEIVEEIGNKLYIGVMQANAAWLLHRAGEYGQAQKQAEEAYGQWANTPYPFQWLVNFPLLALAMQANQLPAAIQFAQAMLDPSQQKLPDELDDMLATAVSFWQVDNVDSAREALSTAVVLAHRYGYL